MIERLQGNCVAKHVGGMIIDVAGVGYGVEMTTSAVARIRDGEFLVAWVHTHLTEGSLRLFGFLTLQERQMFTMLLSVSGLGPKIALAILSRLDAPQLLAIVQQDNHEILEDIPGIGPRQSKKFVLELKPKFAKLVASGALVSQPVFVPDLRLGATTELVALDSAMLRDLQSALENFGYKEKELTVLLRKFERAPPAKSLADLIRLALAELTGAARAESQRSAEELF